MCLSNQDEVTNVLRGDDNRNSHRPYSDSHGLRHCFACKDNATYLPRCCQFGPLSKQICLVVCFRRTGVMYRVLTMSGVAMLC